VKRNRLPEIIATLDDELDDMANDLVKAVANEARLRVPFETGALQRAIHVERNGEGSYSVIAGDDDAWYGHIVEFGSVQSGPGQPFLLPALEHQRLRVGELARRALKDL